MAAEARDDGTSERTEGPTPNGGAYAIAYFFDARKEPTTKDRAAFVEIREFSAAGKDVGRAYGTIGPRPGRSAFED